MRQLANAARSFSPSLAPSLPLSLSLSLSLSPSPALSLSLHWFAA